MAAVMDAIELIQQGYRFCWITTQGERQCRLIDYIPSELKKDIELFTPYKKGSKGFNWLKCYTNKEQERIIKADTTVILIENMSDRMSDNMKHGIRLATSAVLEYWYKTKQVITLYDAWMFIKRPSFREHVLRVINNNVIAEDMCQFKQDTLDAISRRFSAFLNNKLILNALCYTKEDALDFQDMFNKIFICDFIEDNLHGLGSLNAIMLAQAVLIQFELLASTRNNDSNYYEIICDEFYRYTRGIEDTFKGFPDRHRQRRIGLYLIWQRMSQMSGELVDVALSMVNKYFMTMEVDDDHKLGNKELYKQFKGQFSKLKEREYIAYLNTGIGTSIETGRTKDLEKPNASLYNYVITNCKSKYSDKWQWWFNEHSDDSIDLVKYGKVIDEY